MKRNFKKFHTFSVAVLTTLSFSVMANNTFTLNGRAVQLEPVGKSQEKGARSAANRAQVTVRDLTSGQTSVYADGLIITLKDAGTLKSVLNDYPAVTLQYAPGAYAYVKVSREQLATTFDALAADTRVAAVHLRPVPVQIKPR